MATRRRKSPQQIVRLLGQAESMLANGEDNAGVCRALDTSGSSFHRWRNQYGGMKAGDNPDRMTSEAAFAALCGASPVPASSGKTTAMRLNRGGNRQANTAPYRIAVVRMSHHHLPTVDYLTRRTAEGRTKRAVLRCLKRFIAREIYSHLVHPKPAIQTDDLCARRTAIGQPLRVVAVAVGAHLKDISRLERCTNHDADLALRYREWVKQLEARTVRLLPRQRGRRLPSHLDGQVLDRARA